MWASSRLALFAALAARPLAAQQRELGLLYGHWGGSRTVIYEARLDRPLVRGWLRHGVTLHAITERGGSGRDFFGLGYELQAFRAHAAFGPYGVLGATLGVATDTGRQELAALWSVGGGLEWRPFRFVGLAVEERYRLIDHGPHGFWQPGSPHKGWSTAVGLSIALGGGGGGARRVAAPPDPPLLITGRAADVAQTAVEVIGTPYQWGGTAENGFDCSGLIQYAYGRHGIRLPRTSRDQARFGSAVPPVLDSLWPGDILAFAAQPGGGVTHVGMYVGEGKFIHSSSNGVRLSRLDPGDPDGAYWIPRLVGVRRIMQ